MTSQTSSTKRTDVGPVNLRFSDFGLDAGLLTAIKEIGWVVPSRIQEKVIPMGIAGQNIIARSRNGTGKTGAYVIPLLQRIDATKPHTQAMIMVTSRELVMQVHSVVKRLSKHMSISVMYNVSGPEGSNPPVELLEAHILIGTPGRLGTLLDMKSVRLSQCQIVVMDEADWLITRDMKYGCVTKVLNALVDLPQMIFVTTTLPAYLEEELMNYAPEMQIVNVISHNMNLRRVSHFYSKMDENDKFDRLMTILKNYKYNRAIVFCRSTSRVNTLCHDLFDKGLDTICINADMSESLRTDSYFDLLDGYGRVIVTSDLFSRGIDIPSVDMIVNYDFPWKAAEYLHRAGRCGRYGASGSAISFIAPGDKNTMTYITGVLSLRILPLEDHRNKPKQEPYQEDEQELGEEPDHEVSQEQGQELDQEPGQEQGQEQGQEPGQGSDQELDEEPYEEASQEQCQELGEEPGQEQGQEQGQEHGDEEQNGAD